MKASTPLTLAGLKRQWQPWAAGWERRAKRIDALSLRERVILFLGIAAVLAAVLDALVLSPMGARAKQRAAEAAAQTQELKAMREQFIAASRGGERSDALTQMQAQLVAARQERERLDRELASTQAAQAAQVGASAEAGLPTLLQALLAQQPGLTLSRLRLLESRGPAAPSTVSLSLPGMGWQGVELQVQGAFAQQQRFVQALERQLPGLQWGELRLSSPTEREAPQLSAQVFVLKVRP
jgi:MSHA biogenesis protein MshJ